jgi:hypothetical protein|tara:strand:- start:415 stop:540 length:126 start_codon:yes stop_codon:yes gene_type:complete
MDIFKDTTKNELLDYFSDMANSLVSNDNQHDDIELLGELND